jgi:cell division protein FtsZ
MIVIPNEKLLAVAKDAGFFESFRIADDVLRQGVQGISDIITIPGIINRDFADVKTTMAGMGHAVMGTAVRSGSNRAVEAAQAAMASPLLDAGAIDGARGILINITGSSSLKLSEVNEASSLIESAAHEDANIIFGAVLDEKMGEEVKITVIATGFRDQMPERRARMLSVDETPVVSVPVVSTGNWMRERSPEPAPAPARFMSEEEDAATENADDGFFFAAAAPGVATTVTVASPAKQVASHEMELATDNESAPSTGPQSADKASESDNQPRDYASDFAATPRDGAEAGADTGTPLFSGPAEQPERDLDVPTFLRRLKF